MTGIRYITPVLLGTLVLAGCAEQEGGDMDTGMQADTAAAEEQASMRDTASTDLATWNTDADARLAQEEFDGWLEEQDFYGEWNTDGADGLTAQELGAGLFGVLDADDDGSIGESEFGEAAAWAGTGASLSDWDDDGNGSLSEAELASGFQDGDLWSEWDQDADGSLSESEFNQAVFGAWDANDDGYVDESEWAANHDRWS